MERDMPPQNTTLCRSGCGFYGSSATDGLCSKCYKDALKRKQAAPTSGFTSTTSSSATATVDSTNGASAPLVVSSPLMSSSPAPQPSPVSSCHTESNSSLMTAALVPDSKVAPAVDTEVAPTAADSKSTAASAADVANGAVASATADTKVVDKKKKKTRCTKCKVSVGVIGFPCRCGGIFCSVHRYANEHSCSFDYKEHGAEEIRKNNPQVVGEKIQKI